MEDTGKSMMCALYILRYVKGTVGLKQCQKQGKIKPIAIAVIKVHLPEGISQSINQSVSQLVSQAIENSIF